MSAIPRLRNPIGVVDPTKVIWLGSPQFRHHELGRITNCPRCSSPYFMRPRVKPVLSSDTFDMNARPHCYTCGFPNTQRGTEYPAYRDTTRAPTWFLHLYVIYSTIQRWREKWRSKAA